MEELNNAAAIISTVERLAPAELMELADGVGVMSVPTGKGREIQSIKKFIDEYRDAPERKRGTARLLEPLSFVEHVNRTKDDGTVLFACADKDKPSMTAVYNYNLPDGTPRFADHRAVYPFPLSDEWKAWMAKNGARNQMSQEDFAEFIEDRMMDLGAPTLAGARTKAYVEAIECELATPAQVATLSRELAIRVEQNVVQSTKLGSGEGQLLFREEHKDQNGAPVKVPGAFLIVIPIFTGGLSVVLPVRLRYRVSGGAVAWFYEIALVDALFKEAVDEEIKRIQAGVELPVFVGSPES